MLKAISCKNTVAFEKSSLIVISSQFKANNAVLNVKVRRTKCVCSTREAATTLLLIGCCLVNSQVEPFDRIVVGL
jgi:hypothetical protein